MTLILHKGAKEVDYAALREVETPPPTGSHFPIAHYRVADLAKHSLTFYGHQVVEEHHAVTDDGLRYFGLLVLKSEYGNYTDTLGLRNSADKSFPVGIAFGSKVLVCDNLSFMGSSVIKRKHTQKLHFELPGLIASIIEPLAVQREEQHQKILGYQHSAMTDMMADHAIMRGYREGVINLTRIADVATQWETPEHDWGEKTAWRLMNAFTFALNGRVMENADITPKLHKIIDATVN